MLRSLVSRSLRLHRYVPIRSIGSFTYPSEDPNLPGVRCYADLPKTLRDNRLGFHHEIHLTLLSGKLDDAYTRAGKALTDALTSLTNTGKLCTAISDNLTEAITLSSAPAQGSAVADESRDYQKEYLDFLKDASTHSRAALDLIQGAISASRTALQAGVGFACYQADEKLKALSKTLVSPNKTINNKASVITVRSLCTKAKQACSAALYFCNRFPSVHTANLIISSFHTAGRHREAIECHVFFFTKMKLVPNSETLHTFILAHIASGMSDTAFHIFEQTLANPRIPFRPSLRTYRALTSALVDVGRASDALDFIRDMIFRGHGADSLMFDVVVRAYVADENLEMAMCVFSELSDNCDFFDGAIVATLMEGFFGTGMGEKAMDAYKDLILKKFRMSARTGNTLLTTLLKHGKLREAHCLFQGMLARHSPFFDGVNIDTCKIWLHNLLRARELKRAIDVVEDMGKAHCLLDVNCYNQLIEELCLHDMVEDAEAILGRMARNLIKPDAGTFLFLSHGCLVKHQVTQALKYFLLVSRDGRELSKNRVGLHNKVFCSLKEAGFMEQMTSVGIRKL